MSERSLNFDWVKRFAPDAEIANVVTNRDGFNSEIVMFDLSFSRGGETFSGPVVLKSFSSEKSCRKELSIMRNPLLRDRVCVPEIYFEDTDSQRVLMQKVEGVTLDKMYATNPADFFAAVTLFGETLARIHAIEVDGVGECLGNRQADQKKYIESYLASLNDRIVGYETDEVYLHILQRISDRFRHVEFEPCLNHADYHFGNVIVTADKKLYVLDWEKAQVADYRFDLANALTLGYSWHGIDFRSQMLAGYQAVTGKNIPHLDCFEALLSFDSFTKCIPLIQGGDDSHIRDRSFLWLKRRYELFVRHTGMRSKDAVAYLYSKGISLSERMLTTTHE